MPPKLKYSFTYADTAKSPQPAMENPYDELHAALTNTEIPTEQIEARITHPNLRDNDLRKLFAVIRKALLEDLWLHRDLELWLKRAECFGTHYAGTAAKQTSLSKYPSRYTFYRDMDEQLEVEDGSVWRIKGMLLNHALVYRETCTQLKVLREKKTLMLMDGEK